MKRGLLNVFGVALVLVSKTAATCRAGESLRPNHLQCREPVRVVDHGLRPKVYPTYLGPELGWQDLYNQDGTGAYYLERELEFHNVRLGLRLTQTYIGGSAHPAGLLGLRYRESNHLVTATQPVWDSTWCRCDDKFPGFLDVALGEKGLEGVPVELECGNEGASGFIRSRWHHEAGAVTATFVMLSDDDRLFCEVGITPSVPNAKVAVTLLCWPFGQFVARTASSVSPVLTYGQPYTLPREDHTVLFTDPRFDPTGTISQGTCALTYFPEECVSVTATRTFPLFVTLNLSSTAEGGSVYAHFVLWELLHRRGDGAFVYVAEREVETLSLFDSLGAMQDAKLAAARDKGIKQVRDTLAAFDRPTKATHSPRENVAFSSGSWRLSDQALNWRWARFYRDETVRYLASGNWRQASQCVALASQFLAKVAAPGRQNSTQR